MKVRVQLYSDQKPLGPQLRFDITFVAQLRDRLLETLDHTPDEFDGVRVVNWTHMTIEIER